MTSAGRRKKASLRPLVRAVSRRVVGVVTTVVVGCSTVVVIPATGCAGDAGLGISAALVVGVNAYDNEKKLEGAVNDAAGIADALKKAGVPKITLLVDGDVTADRFRRAWKELLAQAGRGDRIFLSYAGHGAQTTAVNPVSESDGLDEVLVLPHFFAGTKAGQREQIYDNEINQWLADAKAKGVEVVAVFDSCHSGTITRDIVPGNGGYRSREVPRFDRLAGVSEMSSDERGVDDPEAPPDNVFQFSAAQDSQAAIEVPIDEGAGRIVQHGALSYAMAQAIAGRADRNGDGVTTFGELVTFIRQAVKQYAESRHTPNFFPQDEAKLDTVIFRGGSPAVPPMVRPATLRLAVTNGDGSPTADSGVKGVAGVAVKSDIRDADLIWNVGLHTLFTSVGEMVSAEITADRLPAAVEKWRLLGMLKNLALAGSVTTTLRPDDRTHHRGDKISIGVDNQGDPYLILFNLTGTGELQFLYPLDGDPVTVPTDQPFRLDDIVVTPPFGADHLVVVSLPEARPDIVKLLQSLHQSRQIAGLGPALADKLANTRYRLAIQAIYTADRR